MELIQTVSAMHACADAARVAGRRLGLVPTMGALHEGHLALIREARRHSDHLTVTIFVNPTQFAPGEDFERYPRTLQHDLDRLEALDCVDVVFAPTPGEMYPGGTDANRTWVRVEGLDQHLCGRYRAGHFTGVTTVVARLFNICKPHVAVFGRKDAQQFLILRRMVRDLHYDITLIGVPTVREADGLALSSRNMYLSEAERAQAVVLSEAVAKAKALVAAGERRAEIVIQSMCAVLAAAPDAIVQYVEIVDTETLQPVDLMYAGQEVLAAVAVYFGDTRLIDNAFIQVSPYTSIRQERT